MTSRKKKPDPVSKASPGNKDLPAKQKYEPTAEEKDVIRRHVRRRSERNPAPRMKVNWQGNSADLSYDHEDRRVAYILLAEALGTTDGDFVNGILVQLLNAVKRDGKVKETDFNFMLSVIKDIEPRDQLESMLAAQMAVVHEAAMTMARRLGNVEDIRQQDSAINGLTKLTRNFAALLDAHKRYRHGGEQRVVVQHVNVNDGGQAIVANVAAQPGRPGQQEEKTGVAPALTHSAQAPMPMLDELAAEAVPLELAESAKANGRKKPL